MDIAGIDNNVFKWISVMMFRDDDGDNVNLSIPVFLVNEN